MEKDLADLFKQHEENYRQAVSDLIQNNTSVLVDEDIVSLIKKPPLDSMDLLRAKFLDLAKKNKTVLNTEQLDILLEQYRSMLIECCGEIKKERITELQAKTKSVSLKNKNLIKINKKDFVGINKKMKSIMKQKLVESYEITILKNMDLLFHDSVSIELKNKIKDDFSKYILGVYQKQLIESIELKILVKDTTLMNRAKEQGERYLFTLDNSRLLNDFES